VRYHPGVRRKLPALVLALLVLLLLGGWGWFALHPFPSDHTPEGAYARVVLSLTEQRPRDMFAYLETEAQWAAYTIHDMRAKAYARVKQSYPPAEGAALLEAYRAEAEAPDGSDVFVLMAKRRNWLTRLRKDTSGVARVDVEGERASVVTARGTRYPFRRRDNGIWGLTIFTADLVAEAEKATRDLAVVEAAANDYDRVKGREGALPAGSTP
jgi:hypothetical protein